MVHRCKLHNSSSNSKWKIHSKRKHKIIRKIHSKRCNNSIWCKRWNSNSFNQHKIWCSWNITRNSSKRRIYIRRMVYSFNMQRWRSSRIKQRRKIRSKSRKYNIICKIYNQNICSNIRRNKHNNESIHSWKWCCNNNRNNRLKQSWTRNKNSSKSNSKWRIYIRWSFNKK